MRQSLGIYPPNETIWIYLVLLQGLVGKILGPFFNKKIRMVIHGLGGFIKTLNEFLRMRCVALDPNQKRSFT